MCDCQPITEIFRVPSLHCQHELAIIRKGLDGLAGIADVTADYISNSVRVEYCPHRLDAVAISGAIEDVGFDVIPPAEIRPVAAGEEEICTCKVVPGHESARPRWRVTTTVGGLLLLLGIAVWAIAGGTTVPVVAVLVGSAVACGIPVVRAAWRSLRHWKFDMNVLMSIAAIGAFGIGEYFEAATAMFLFSVSLWLEALSMDRARRAVQSLVELAPTVAHRLRISPEEGATGCLSASGSQQGPKTLADKQPVAPLDAADVQDVDPNELAVGDVVLLRPGEMVPVDGTVIEGASSLNQAAITGESIPVEKEPHSEVFAGSLNGEGALWIRATRTAESSTLSRIAHMVAQAQAARSPTERFVERFAARYTPLVIALAVLLAFGMPALGNLGWSWAASVSPGEWFSRALVLLVIACPCALVISTPVTIVCGLYRAARRGILVKGGQFLETAGQIRAVALDKTGTLTLGRPQVVAVEPAAGRTAEEVLSAAASLESHSEHPLAGAIVAEARRRGLAVEPASDFTAMRGFGVRGTVGGQTVFVGSPRMFTDAGATAGLPSSVFQEFLAFTAGQASSGTLFQQEAAGDDSVEDMPSAAAGTTPAMVATADAFWGTIRLADRPRPEAARAVADLKSLGLESVSMLTGDSQAVAESIAQKVGIDRCYAELLPDEKVAQVRKIAAESSPMAMVGDGVNDAPAMAASQLGIALGAEASDTALETADVAIMTADLGRVAELIRLGRRTRRILGQNIFLALAIKAIVLAAAAVGLATLWMAVVADVGASMLVIGNGMRLTGGRQQDA